MNVSRESVVGSAICARVTTRTVAKTPIFRRLGGEVKDSGFQEA
ncbi:hypothetical protein LROSRS0_1537 [Furfurilactobacillus rossiae]|nr:hypothetical protein LROSRS0_1537 [Furfurilactobacillus rossiae]QLE64378.1 hypothetical protein LROSL1_1561 [Furfurilactobacillus rossiae]